MDADSAQVLDLLAEEVSLEELLVALDELLASNKISIDDFMGEVRHVGRRAFLCKVLREKSEEAVRAAGPPTEMPVARAVAVAAPVARTPVAA